MVRDEKNNLSDKHKCEEAEGWGIREKSKQFVQQFAIGFTDTKPEAAERSEIADHRKRAGKTVPAKGPTTGNVTWELDRLYGYAWIRRARLRKPGQSTETGPAAVDVFPPS